MVLIKQSFAATATLKYRNGSICHTLITLQFIQSSRNKTNIAHILLHVTYFTKFANILASGSLSKCTNVAECRKSINI